MKNDCFMERLVGLEPTIRDLQSRTLPLGDSLIIFCTIEKENYLLNPTVYVVSTSILSTHIILSNDIQYLYRLLFGGITYFAGFFFLSSFIITLYVPSHPFITMFVPFVYVICNFSTTSTPFSPILYHIKFHKANIFKPFFVFFEKFSGSDICAITRPDRCYSNWNTII